VTRTWYNITRAASQDIAYAFKPWDSTRYYVHTGDTSPDDKVYWQDPAIDVYQEEVKHFGYTYGENSYHYMLVEVNGNTCTISAHHVDGSLMAGPGDAYPQQYVLTHA
jgi:hypothetical protein